MLGIYRCKTTLKTLVSPSKLISGPLLISFRGYRKHVDHLSYLRPGEIHAKTINVEKEGGIIPAFTRINALLRKEKYYDQVRSSQYFERPTDRRKRIRNEARWKRYREYISAKLYSSNNYYHRKSMHDKYNNNY